MMDREIPGDIAHAINKPVLDFIQPLSAHADVSEALAEAVQPLGDVQLFCPDPSRYKYWVASTQGILFGLAMGMNIVAFRLNPPYNHRGLETGGALIPGLSNAWIGFVLFRDDWPRADLTFWARKAYVYARETKGL
jgi:hypothetical protein